MKLMKCQDSGRFERMLHVRNLQRRQAEKEFRAHCPACQFRQRHHPGGELCAAVLGSDHDEARIQRKRIRLLLPRPHAGQPLAVAEQADDDRFFHLAIERHVMIVEVLAQIAATAPDGNVGMPTLDGRDQRRNVGTLQRLKAIPRRQAAHCRELLDRGPFHFCGYLGRVSVVCGRLLGALLASTRQPER